jgi:hypothetical protein
MKFFSLSLLILLLSTSLTSLAQEEKSLLILPLEMKGTYRPIESAELSSMLKTNIESVAPKVSVSIYDQKTYMMSPEEASRIGKAAGADYVLYGDARFRKEVKGAKLTGVNTEGYPGGSGIRQGYASRYMVTVAAVGHGKLVDVATGKLISEQPELLLESEYTGAAKGGSRMEQLEQKLANTCIHQFTKHLIEKMKAEVDGKR